MEEVNDGGVTEKPNDGGGGGVFVELDDGGEKEEVTLYCVLNRLISSIFSSNNQDSTYSFFDRIKQSLSENVPLFQEAFRNTGRHVLLWTQRGGPLRSIFVISVGTITLLALSGLLAFMVFFIVATINAIVISLLMSLAAAGGILVLFFACVTAIYVGALFIAVFVISSVTISAIIAALIATGWIGFFWMVWVAIQKSASLAKRSLSMSGEVISAYSSSRHAHPCREEGKVSD